jgi:2-dehydropantoate 2-reductase
MRILIVGIGALGGTIATRALKAKMDVQLAARDVDSAKALRDAGLRVSGVGGEATAASFHVAAIKEYKAGDGFDLILLATKAQDALEIAPFLSALLAPGGTLLPIQNGGVSQMLVDRLGEEKILGGFSNLGATMVERGVYEQRNDGHLLIGELSGGVSDRSERIAQALSGAVEVRISSNLRAAIWAKLLMNCSVTTIGAIAGQTMRQYMQTFAGREIFRRAYDETLCVALATGIRPESLAVDPIPPGWQGSASVEGDDYQAWVDGIIAFYGDIKPSMLQDFERGRKTEIDFINGYVVRLGGESRVQVPMNAAITDVVRGIERGQIKPAAQRLSDLLRLAAN